MPFSVFGLNPDIIRGIKDLAYTRPTPVQTSAIPPAMLGRDVLACAVTGSGKTAAFLLPTIHRLMSKPGRGPRALVLTPTRELAAQIHQNLLALATHTRISGAAVFGGVAMGPQEHAFRTHVDILIATPGRLLDHLRNSYASFSGLEILILDEADRMLDMGFLPDIRRILRVLPTQRQTLFFSATMPAEIRHLTGELLKDPVTLQLERQGTPAVGITQAIYPVPAHLKSSLLLEMLKDEELESVICFTRTKHRANRLADFLKRNHISCVPIHGNRSQAQRTAALAGFKSGQFRMLVATDIAARGIDISDVSHVINFDCPHLADDYIHRVGRTGRASATGDAFTLVSPDEESNVRVIERAIGKRLPRVTLPEFDYTKQAAEKLEVPLAQRIAAIRQRKAQERSHRDQKPRSASGFQPRPHPEATSHRLGGNPPRADVDGNVAFRQGGGNRRYGSDRRAHGSRPAGGRHFPQAPASQRHRRPTSG